MVKNFLPSFSSSDAISSDELAANNTSRDDYSHDVNAPFEDVYISASDELADSYDTSSDELFETFNPTAGKMTKLIKVVQCEFGRKGGFFLPKKL